MRILYILVVMGLLLTYLSGCGGTYQVVTSHGPVDCHSDMAFAWCLAPKDVQVIGGTSVLGAVAGAAQAVTGTTTAAKGL